MSGDGWSSTRGDAIATLTTGNFPDGMFRAKLRSRLSVFVAHGSLIEDDPSIHRLELDGTIEPSGGSYAPIWYDRDAMLSRFRLEARRYVGAVVADGFFTGASRLARLHPRAKPQRHAVEHIVDVPYLDGSGLREHLLDVWRPAEVPVASSSLFAQRHPGPPWPIVFYVHGGGFRILSKDTHWVMGLGFARRGFIVFNVSYRLAPKHRYPTPLEDVCRAFDWVVKNAARYGGDTSRIVLAGESAGANLVTSLALALAYERPEPFANIAWNTGVVPRAVVPACGVFQVSDLERLRRRKPRMSAFVADRLAEVEAAYLGAGPWPCALDLADPVCVLERGKKPNRPLPPFFLPVGTKDPLLPDTRRLGEALRKLGAEAVESYYPGELHAFHAFVMRGVARKCWADTFAFLDRHVPLEQPAQQGTYVTQ